ncbi:MAG: NAD(P)H-binding protein [Acidobacteriota bacterium]
MPRVLLTGATGFVGSRLYPILRRRGVDVCGLTRDPARARSRFPDRLWLEGDAGDERALQRAFEGCSAAYYLVHEMGATADFRAREVATAHTFARAAAAAGLERIVYLGGVLPESDVSSEHLRSRAETGRILMEGSVPALELRASMIIGHGSLSFLIVRDLAARLPFMILPRWLDSRTEPVAIDDVLLALDGALEIPLPESRSFDIPGPEILSGREILLRTTAALAMPKPIVVRVPVLTPGLSSHWVRFVTRAEWKVAREIVVGLTTDLLARDRRYWELIDNPRLTTFDEAAHKAIEEERGAGARSGFWETIERVRHRLGSGVRK